MDGVTEGTEVCVTESYTPGSAEIAVMDGEGFRPSLDGIGRSLAADGGVHGRCAAFGRIPRAGYLLKRSSQ